MKNFLLNQILAPFSRKVGTGIATWLVTLGIGQPIATQVGLGVAAAIAVGIDLYNSHLDRK